MSKICCGRLPRDHSNNPVMKSDALPLPLAGEGWGEGGLELYSPHLYPLPMGERIKVCAFEKFLIIFFPIGFGEEEMRMIGMCPNRSDVSAHPGFLRSGYYPAGPSTLSQHG
jgi:hypothetical protein